MNELVQKQRELFCRYVADGESPELACFHAGYGKDYDKMTTFHKTYSRRLMERPEVRARIATLQKERSRDNPGIRQKLLNYITSVAFFDLGELYSSGVIEDKTGRKHDYFYLTKPFNKIDPDVRRLMFDHIDARGNACTIEKKWALELLAKIYLMGLDAQDVEDTVTAFLSAGLPPGSFTDDVDEEDKDFSRGIPEDELMRELHENSRLLDRIYEEGLTYGIAPDKLKQILSNVGKEVIESKPPVGFNEDDTSSE